MKYCPTCGTEYLDRAEVCADCGVPLLSEMEQARASAEAAADSGALLCEVADGVEADLVAGLLAAEGIPAQIRSNVETVHIGFAEDHSGWGEIWVPRSRLHEAKSLVEAYSGTSPEHSPEDG